MKKYIIALIAGLVMLVGSVAAVGDGSTPPTYCADCWANSISQTDVQKIYNIDPCVNDPIIFNEGLTSAVTITPEYGEYTNTAGVYVKAGFSRVEQSMTQTIDNYLNPAGLTANKAIQAAWTEDQGGKEYNKDSLKWDYEGSLIQQSTTQLIEDIQYTSNENQKAMAIFNADNKLAVISNDMDTLTKTLAVNSNSVDSSTSTGVFNNDATIDAAVSGTGPVIGGEGKTV